jgi:transposase
VNYPETFKQQMVRRLSGPGAISANALSKEVDVAQTTLSQWLREATKIGSMSKKKTSKPRRPQDWTAEEKLQAVMEASGLSEEELGAFLRSKGLHEAQLEQWRRKVSEAASEALSRGGGSKARTAGSRRIRELERELRRKDKALAEAAALLVLKKKLAALWEDEDDSTGKSNGS